MIVEAIFWFHPLVWWIGARLVEERERACDEDVLRLGNEPLVYAESILKVCQFYVEQPLMCVAGVTGADLKKRIEEIMTDRIIHQLGLGRKTVLALAGAMAVAGPVAIGIMAQSQPAFEAASIKPSRPETPERLRFMPGGGITGGNVNLKWLMQMAYRIKDFQVSGGPGWIGSEGYDVIAKATGNPTQDQTRLMVRTLLAERFKLSFHREMRELPVYSLVVAKSGPKLQEVKREAGPGDGGFGWGPGRIDGKLVSMQAFAELLSTVLKRIVIDRTGIQGNFDFNFLYTPEGYQPREAGNPNEGRPDPNGPSMFTAIQEQLGLKLEPGKAPVEIFVIDHAEKASEN
jgi:uncharacterized protein (TIGR03435 family)